MFNARQRGQVPLSSISGGQVQIGSKQPTSSPFKFQFGTPGKAPSGGYEHEFIGEIPDKYKCMICHKVQKEATITSCCCKHYCKFCIEEWFRKQGKSCPHCRSTSFNHFVNRQQVQDINELGVCCSNHDAGCQWEGKLEELESHIYSKCEFSSIDCPNKCRETMLRNNLENHKLYYCLLRLYICQYCGLKDTYHAITGECGKYGHCDVHKGHYKICQDYPLECTNKCGEKAIKRKNMESHLEECLLQPVDCPFEEVGCTARVVRKDLQEHVDSSDHNHLMLMMTAFKELKKENEQMKKELKKENGDLMKRITENTSKIATLQSSPGLSPGMQMMIGGMTLSPFPDQFGTPLNTFGSPFSDQFGTPLNPFGTPPSTSLAGAAIPGPSYQPARSKFDCRLSSSLKCCFD